MAPSSPLCSRVMCRPRIRGREASTYTDTSASYLNTYADVVIDRSGVDPAVRVEDELVRSAEDMSPACGVLDLHWYGAGSAEAVRGIVCCINKLLTSSSPSFFPRHADGTRLLDASSDGCCKIYTCVPSPDDAISSHSLALAGTAQVEDDVVVLCGRWTGADSFVCGCQSGTVAVVDAATLQQTASVRALNVYRVRTGMLGV